MHQYVNLLNMIVLLKHKIFLQEFKPVKTKTVKNFNKFSIKMTYHSLNFLI